MKKSETRNKQIMLLSGMTTEDIAGKITSRNAHLDRIMQGLRANF